ncbi:insertion element protein [Bacillus licheniformis WX-02]|nr:insertion element protein [Bacillus licheniformis WX-02]
MRGYQGERSVCNLLKYIGKLPRAEKEQVYQWVKRYAEPSSIVGVRL